MGAEWIDAIALAARRVLDGSEAGETVVGHADWRVGNMRFADDATLLQRLTTRTSNSYGKASHELEETRAGHARFEDAYRRFGAQVLDAALPVGVVLDELLSSCNATLLRAR